MRMLIFGFGETGSSGGSVDNRNVVRGDASFRAHFLVALEKPVIELAIGVDLTLQDIVANPERLLGQGGALELAYGACKL
jgi:hypothetical protein